MLELVWLLAAVEINGVLASKGAQVAITDAQCLVERSVLAGRISEETLSKAKDEKFLSFAKKQCVFREDLNLIELTLSEKELAHRKLVLSEGSTLASVSLLHDPKSLASSSEFAAQPFTTTLPAAAFDLFAGSRFLGLGSTITKGPWSLQTLSQKPDQATALNRITAEYFFKDGAQIRVGDFRAARGPEQQLTESFGLFFTNRASALRGDGKAESELSITSPSRVYFFDQYGSQIYSSELLTPGNYQVQGYGANTMPGFLEARLVDTHGNTRSVLLAWSADRRLLAAGQMQWEGFFAKIRSPITQTLQAQSASAAIRYGVSPHLTAALYADHAPHGWRLMSEASSRKIPRLIATAAAGVMHTGNSFMNQWLLEARTTMATRATLTAGLAKTTDSSAMDLGSPAGLKTAYLNLAGNISDRFTAIAALSHQSTEAKPNERSAIVSTRYQFAPSLSLSAQARHTWSNDKQSWSALIGLSLSFAAQKTHANTSLHARSPSAASDSEIYRSAQIHRQSDGPYGPQWSVAHTDDRLGRTDAFFRYATAQGDLSLRTDTVSQLATWSASTRLWVSQGRLIQSPTGDENLVIQNIGLSDIRVIHRAKDAEVSGDDGHLVFRRAPIWTETTYTLDAKTIPFGMNIAATKVRIPLASNRVYHVDYSPLWSRLRTWRIPQETLKDLGADLALTHTGKNAYFNADGYVDLQSKEDLPIRITPRSGLAFICDAPKVLSLADAEVRLICKRDTAS